MIGVAPWYLGQWVMAAPQRFARRIPIMNLPLARAHGTDNAKICRMR